MSQEERDWLHWLKQVRDGVVTQRQAAECMKVTERWVRELMSRYEQVGDVAVVHGLRGEVIEPADRGEDPAESGAGYCGSRTGTTSGRRSPASNFPSCIRSKSVRKRCGPG